MAVVFLDGPYCDLFNAGGVEWARESWPGLMLQVPRAGQVPATLRCSVDGVV